jgi:predicted component of type VI protein secretion system
MTTNAEYMRRYRSENAEYREKERARYLQNKQRLEERYSTDDAYRQQKIEYAKNRYRLMKQMKEMNEMKANNAIVSN